MAQQQRNGNNLRFQNKSETNFEFDDNSSANLATTMGGVINKLMWILGGGTAIFLVFFFVASNNGAQTNQWQQRMIEGNRGGTPVRINGDNTRVYRGGEN